MTSVGERVTAFRCSVDAERRGDSMLGTAAPQTRVLLVHQPGPWGPKGLVESRCDPDVARRIDRAAAKSGMRLQAIRLPGKHDVGMPREGYRFGIADTRVGAARVTWWCVDDLARAADDLESGWPQRAPIAIDSTPLYLVCAHGRHDACCALRGRPVAQALQRERPGRVWETTHLGGDRFSANLLVLPTGELYGRVPPALAASIVARADAGEVIPRLMRGRIGVAPIAQAAMIYAQDTLEILARDAFALESIDRVAPDLARVTITMANDTYVVEVGIEVGDMAQLTCRGKQNARAQHYRGLSIALRAR